MLIYLQLLYDSSLLFVIYNSTKIQVTKRKNGTYYIHTSDFIISDPVHWYGEGCCSSCRVSVRATCFCVGLAQGNGSAHASNGLSGCMQPSADFVTLTASVTAVACGPLTYKATCSLIYLSKNQLLNNICIQIFIGATLQSNKSPEALTNFQEPLCTATTVISILGTLLYDSVPWTEKLDVMKTMWWLQNGQEALVSSEHSCQHIIRQTAFATVGKQVVTSKWGRGPVEQDDFDAIVHARASALHALLQFQGPAGTSLHSERNPAHFWLSGGRAQRRMGS